MIYDFSHFPTPTGRRVQFVAARADVEPAAHKLGTSWFAEHARAGADDDIVITATPADARRLVDALAGQGGEAAVASRMLADAIDDMVTELRASRAASAERRRRYAPVAEMRASA